MPSFAILRPMSFTPTTEQGNITAAADTGENVRVTAVAGSGKTSTLKLIALARPTTSFLMLAFGKDIQLAFEKANLSNVEARTSHSVAWWHLKDHHPAIHRRLKADIKPWGKTAPENVIGVPSTGHTFENGDQQEFYTARKLGAKALLTVAKFCRTADAKITERHVPREFENNTDQAMFARFITPYAVKAWADITSTNGKLKVDGNHYIKIWSLDCPKLTFDCILFDEAQDANPAVSHVINAQTCQIIMVGDKSQAIYAWNGAVDSLSKFEAPHKLTLTQSFRFGPEIANFANLFLDALDADVRIVGNAALDSKIVTTTDADAVLCRTNAGVIEYAIDFLAQGKRVAIAGGTGELMSFARAAKKLQTGGFIVHPDLAGFDNWADVVAHAGTDEGSELRVKVSLVQTHGADKLIEILGNLKDAKTAPAGSYDVVVSTAHKAKGLEWDSVMIGSDFRLPTEAGAKPSDADLMLMYVAVTRAKLTLNPGILAMLFA